MSVQFFFDYALLSLRLANYGQSQSFFAASVIAPPALSTAVQAKCPEEFLVWVAW